VRLLLQGDGRPAAGRPGFACKKKKNSGTAKNLKRRSDRGRALRLQERSSWPRKVLRDEFCDDGVVRIRLAEPEFDPTHEDSAGIPVDPDVIARLEQAEADLAEAQRRYWEAQRELRSLQVEAEVLKD
jgi:hypothetical protein